MDMKIIGAVFVVAILAFVGVGYATNWFHGNMNATNQTWSGNMNQTHVRGMPPGNFTRANSTTIQQFEQSIKSDDFQTATDLHATYGLGGPMFGKLNSTTFSQYSQIVNLEAQLGQELGMNQSIFMGGFGMQMQHGGFGRSHGFGRRMPRMNQTG